MVKLEGRCIIYSKIDNNNFYTSIFELCGGVSTILSSAIAYIRNLNGDDRYDNFYVVIVSIDDHLDQNIQDLDYILSLDPVISIFDNKRIKDYKSELENLISLSGIETITPEINNTIIDYKNIIQNYNSSHEKINNNCLDDILSCIEKFISVIKKYDGNSYRILDYIDKKFYDNISDDIVQIIYDKMGMTLFEFTDLIKKYDLNFDLIQKILIKSKIDGSIEIKKQLINRIVKKYDKN